MENKAGIILGLIIGTIVAIAILNRNMTHTLRETIPITQSIQKSELNWSPIDIPRVDDLLLKLQTQTYDSRLNQIESQLEKTTLHLEEATSKLLDLNNAIYKIQTTEIRQPLIQQPHIQPVFIQQPPNVIVHPIENKSENNSIQTQQIQPVQPILKTNKDVNIDNKINLNHSQDTIYKNNEKWDIKRGPDGRIKSLNIIRDVKKWEK